MWLYTVFLLLLPLLQGASTAKVGHSDGFKKASDLLRASVNFSADPCNDFFEFACGKWLAENEIPADLTSYGRFTVVREKVQKEMNDLLADHAPSTSRAINELKLFYTACMDEDALNERRGKELLEALTRLGYWPMLHNERWRRDTFDFTSLLIGTDSARGVTVFVDVYPSTDMKNVTRRIINIDQSSLGLGNGARDYYLDAKKYAKQLAAYKRYIMAKVRLLAEDAGLELSERALEADADEIIALEKRYAAILVPEEERRNYTQLYNIVKLDDLKRLLPIFDWERYLRALLPFDVHNYLNEDPDFVITEPAFLERLTKLLRETDQRVIANYVLLRFSSSYNMQLGVRYEDAAQDFMRDLTGKAEKSPRWKDCTASALSKMNYASAGLYVRHHFDKASKKTTLEMIGDLQEAFEGMLHENDWMDDDTKKVALEKAKQMLPLIAYPDFVLNDTALDDYYVNLTLTKEMTFAGLVGAHAEWANARAYRRLLEPVERDEFGISSAVVNAFYNSLKNAITFPAAILQSPFFDRDFPKALNYGGIGSVIGHEITHGFDDQGSQFDRIGNLHMWWDPATRAKFEERTQCIIDQYSKQEVEGTGGHHVNGRLTQGENIADNGGVKEAFRAYQRYLKKHGAEKRVPGFEDFSNEQLFYIGYAQTWCTKMRPETLIRQLLTDPHAPHQHRVNVVLSNQPEFSRAFGCAKDARMNPEQKCAVW